MGYSIDPISDHCYPGTSVLFNRFDIRDEAKLNEVESVVVSARNAEWFSEPKAASFDFEHCKAIHYFLFSDLYDWAGQVRTVNISKKGTRFTSAENIECQAELIFQRLKDLSLPSNWQQNWHTNRKSTTDAFKANKALMKMTVVLLCLRRKTDYEKERFCSGNFMRCHAVQRAAATATGITAEPTWQNICVDGKQVTVTACNNAGSNDVKLWDIGQQVAFNVCWQAGVLIDTDAPYTNVASVQECLLFSITTIEKAYLTSKGGPHIIYIVS